MSNLTLGTLEKKKVIYIDLGFIGHTANKIKKFFDGYSETPNQYGRYLKIENYSHLRINKGVMVETNCWDSEEEFKEALMSKLLFSLDD